MASSPKEFKNGTIKETSLSEDFTHMRLKKQLTDVVLLCDGGTLEAHSLVLSIRSLFFQKMFTTNFKESIDKKVHLSYIRLDIMNLILDFMYSNSTEDLSKKSLEDLIMILKSSHMFELSGLAERCWEIIMKSINIENCIDIWNAALLYRSECDENRIIVYVIKNLEEIYEKNKLHLFSNIQIQHLMEEIKSKRSEVRNCFLYVFLTFISNGKVSIQEFEEFLLHQDMDNISKEFMTKFLEQEGSNLSGNFLKRYFERHVLPRMKTIKEIEENVKFTTKKSRRTSYKFFNFYCYKKLDSDYLYNTQASLDIFKLEFDLNTSHRKPQDMSSLRKIDDLPFLFEGDVFVPIPYKSSLFLIGAISKNNLQKYSSQCFLRYNWENNSVDVEPSLPRPVKSPRVCISAETIFVIETTDMNSTTIQKFCVSNRVWVFDTINVGIVDNCVSLGNTLYLLYSNENGHFLYTYINEESRQLCAVPIPYSHHLLMATNKNKIFIFYLNKDALLYCCSSYNLGTNKWKLEEIRASNDISDSDICGVLDEGILFSHFCKVNCKMTIRMLIFREECQGYIQLLREFITDIRSVYEDRTINKYHFENFQKQLIQEEEI